MKESITIKNLGPIQDITINEIKPMTVFIGESGSGKSTLMKAIALFRWMYKMYNIRSYLKESAVSKNLFTFRMETHFKNCGFEKYVSEKTEICYCVKFPDTNSEYILIYKDGRLSGTNEPIDVNNIYYSKLSFISETRNIIPLWANEGASITGAFLGFYFHEVYDDFIQASKVIKEQEIPYLNLHLSVLNTSKGNKFRVIGLKNKNPLYEIDLSQSSSGTQNAIPISLITEHLAKYFDFESSFNRTLLNFLLRTDNISHFKPVKNLGDINKKLFIHIEEPELSLYPDAQCQLIADVVNKCFIKNKNDVNLMFSTHSPYIVNYLNLLIKAYDKSNLVDNAKFLFEDLVVYQVEDGRIENLMTKNERIVNTNSLSDAMNNIYNQYEAL